MNQEFNHQQDFLTHTHHEEYEANEKSQTSFNSMPTQHENIRTWDTDENNDTQPFMSSNHFSEMPHPLPTPQGYDMRSQDNFYRRPIHGGFYGRPRPGFYGGGFGGGFGVPFLGGLASGLLISSAFPPYVGYPYGGYSPPYYYQPPYYY